MAEDVLLSGKKAYEDTSPDKLDNLPLRELESCRTAMYAALMYIEYWKEPKYRDRIELVEKKIDSKRQDRRDRRNAIFVVISTVIGIAALLKGCGPSIRDTFLSKVQPSSTPKTTHNSSSQTLSTTDESVEPGASSSTATPSLEQQSPTTPPQPDQSP